MMFRRVLLLLGSIAVLAACGVAASSGGTHPQVTVPVGAAPPTLATQAGSQLPTTVSSVPRTTVTIPADAQVGALVGGNRVIAIGDSVMASTSRRYSNDMCDALVPLGWQVEVDAETGRFVEFGNEVLDDRLAAGWDVGVILLGNNYRGDREVYLLQLDRMIRRLSPQPVVLLTVSEFTPSRVEVNEVIFELAQKYDNVLIVDWGATTAADTSLTGGDGLHLTDKGRAALAEQVALALGTAPRTDGSCLASDFDDDSSGPVEGTSTTTTVRRPNRSTTSAPQTTDPDTTPGATDPPSGTEP
ncbi:MAG: hypothetical protein Q7V88_10610 [Actinomycetota bacterium]|nr:hypothetical protein [Actinomycetota bacterium]